MWRGLTPEQLDDTTFSPAVRGYNRAEVDAFVQQMAETLRELRAAATPPPPRSLGAEIDQLLEAARSSAEALTNDAQEKATALVADADARAKETIDNAEVRAREMVDAAEQRVATLGREEAAILERLRTLRSSLGELVKDVQKIASANAAARPAAPTAETGNGRAAAPLAAVPDAPAGASESAEGAEKASEVEAETAIALELPTERPRVTVAESVTTSESDPESVG